MTQPEPKKPESKSLFQKFVDNVEWTLALLFPKKSKPVAPQAAVTPANPQHAVPPAPVPPARAEESLAPVAATLPARVSVEAGPGEDAPQPAPQALEPLPPPPASTLRQAPQGAPKTSVPPAANGPVAAPAPQKKSGEARLPVRWGLLPRAFFNVAGILSFVVNIILIIALVIVARELFALKAIVGDHLLYGLYANFIKMDQAHIKTNITVQDNIPVSFSLPISQDTVVTLTEPTRINGATVALVTGGVAINAPANIVLPAGTNLPVHLELTVPVQTTIPVTLNVPVDIPLQQTELHEPFIGLQQVVHPLYYLMQPQVKKPEHLPGCDTFNSFCNWFFYANPPQ